MKSKKKVSKCLCLCVSRFIHIHTTHYTCMTGYSVQNAKEMCVDVEKKNNFPQQGFLHFLPSRSIFTKSFSHFSVYFVYVPRPVFRTVFSLNFFSFLCALRYEMKIYMTYISSVHTYSSIVFMYIYGYMYTTRSYIVTSIRIHGYETNMLHFFVWTRVATVCFFSIVIEYICF